MIECWRGVYGVLFPGQVKKITVKILSSTSGHRQSDRDKLLLQSAGVPMNPGDAASISRKDLVARMMGHLTAVMIPIMPHAIPHQSVISLTDPEVSACHSPSKCHFPH